MQSDYAAEYHLLWERHWWWRSRRRFVISYLRQLHAASRFSSVLDIGCGNGLLFDDLLALLAGVPGATVRGIEPDPIIVDPTSRHASRIVVQPFDERTPMVPKVDVILMLDVMEHIEDDVAAAARVYALLKPGGHFLMTVPALMALWSQHDEMNRHFRRYDTAGLRALLRGAGFEIESLRFYFGWTVLPLLLRRMLNPARKEESAGYHVEVPAAPVNAMMYGASRLEQISLGWCGLPVGTSLIAMARKPVG